MAKLLGQSSGIAWAGHRQAGKHKHRAVPSLQQLLLAATCLLEEKMQPIL